MAKKNVGEEKMLIDTIILIMHKLGYNLNYMSFDLEYYYRFFLKHKDELGVTSDDIVDALFAIDNDCLDFDEYDNAKLKEGVLTKAIGDFEGNDKYILVVKLYEELKPYV